MARLSLVKNKAMQVCNLQTIMSNVLKQSTLKHLQEQLQEPSFQQRYWAAYFDKQGTKDSHIS